MKLPPRAEKCLKLLEDIADTLSFYTGGSDLHYKDIKHLKEYIAEISESKKLSNIKLAQKIKKDLTEDE